MEHKKSFLSIRNVPVKQEILLSGGKIETWNLKLETKNSIFGMPNIQQRGTSNYISKARLMLYFFKR
jgi:hypothetical protein